MCPVDIKLAITPTFSKAKLLKYSCRNWGIQRKPLEACIEGDEGERWVVIREQVKRKLGDFVRFVSKEERDLGQYTRSGKKTF